MEAYRYLAKIYDDCMFDVDYSAWYGYIKSILDEYGTVGEILEMGCGTGNITQYLARDFDVIAADCSSEMLDIARTKARARFVCADMNDFRRDKKCSAVVSAMDAVNYLTEGPEKFFSCACENLSPGGVLLFDISSEYKLRHFISDDMFFDDSDEYTYLWTNELDGSILKMNITMFIPDGDVYRRFDEQHKQRIYTESELISALEKAGFSMVKVYDFLSRGNPGPESERLQFVAVKK